MYGDASDFLFDRCFLAGDKLDNVFDGAGCGEVVDRFSGYAAQHGGDGDDGLAKLYRAKGIVLRVVGGGRVLRSLGVAGFVLCLSSRGRIFGLGTLGVDCICSGVLGGLIELLISDQDVYFLISDVECELGAFGFAELDDAVRHTDYADWGSICGGCGNSGRCYDCF